MNIGVVVWVVAVVSKRCGKKGHIPLKITLMSEKGRGPNLFYRPASALPSLYTYHPSAAP